MTMRRVMRLDELWSGEMRSVRVGECTILLARLDGAVVAYEDRCPHKGLPISSGTLDGAVVTCSGHHWSYDLRDGRGVNPISVRLCALEVEIRDGEIWVDPASRPEAAPIESRLQAAPTKPHGCTSR